MPAAERWQRLCMIGDLGCDCPPSPASNTQAHLRDRVVPAAEAALADNSYACAIDVLCGMGLVASSHVESWRTGRIGVLERVIQGNLHEISSSMAMFRRWALEKGLNPSETRYVRRTRGGIVELQFSKSGDLEIEKCYRTHYASPGLSERCLDSTTTARPRN